MFICSFTQVSAPPFFFCFRRSRGCFVVWFSLSCLSVCLSVLVVSGCVACTKILRQHRSGQGDETSPALLRIIVIAIFGIRRVGTGIPCNHSGHGALNRSHPPPTPFLPNTVKDSPGRGWGTESDRQPYCHTLSVQIARFSPFSKGEMLPVFVFCVFDVWFGVFCRFLSFLLSKGRFLKKFSGANFCFWVIVLVLCFWFLPMFLLHFWRFAPETVRKKFSCCQVWCFLGSFSFSFGFFADVVFRGFFFERQRSGSHRTPLHTHLFCCSLFPFLCPAAFVCFARFGRASRFSSFFSGCHFGPRAFLGFSLN